MSEAPKTRVLVVDDNAPNRALVRSTLADEGYEVVEARSGTEALAAFAAEPPECVLLDVRMPGMDGFEVAHRLRELPGGAEIPIVFITALRDVETFDRAQRMGADDFLTKPVHPSELVLRVEAAVKLCRMGAELREYSALVRRQRDDLIRLQLQKERLTSFVVHDLKNPLSSMALHVQLLLRDSALQGRSKASVEHIRDESRSLLRMILNLLDISKSEEGQLEPRIAEVKLAPLLEEVYGSLELNAQSAGVALCHELEVPWVKADVDLLRRVLENLLDNALRHAPEGTAITVRSVPVEGGTEIRVADRGLGISPAMKEKIFDRFVQLERGDPGVTRTGRGLGLAFCRLAVEAHGGSIWWEDASPGAVFCMRFPDDEP